MSTKQLQSLSKGKKYFLLVVFCFVQFLDAFNFSALFSALPHIQEDLHMNAGETTWIISAFQLTFASFLLLSGRLSDVTNPSTSSNISSSCGLNLHAPRRIHLCDCHSWHWLYFHRDRIPQREDSVHRAAGCRGYKCVRQLFTLRLDSNQYFAQWVP